MVKRRIRRAMERFAKMCQHKPVTAVIQRITPPQLLRGKVALVTGGTGGIGKAIAKEFFEAGAFVVITSRSASRAQIVASEIDATGKRVMGYALDVTMTGTFEATLSELLNFVPGNKIDILVNNAGMVGGDIRNTTELEFDEVMATNVRSVFFLSKLVALQMVGNGLRGNILNIASSSSLRPANSAYMISKWGIRGLTEGLAKMLIPHGIVVNGIAPGPTATPMLGKNDYSDVGLDTSPIGRYVLPEEIASMALFLAGPQGRSVVGDIVYMTGGSGIIEQNDVDYTFLP